MRFPASIFLASVLMSGPALADDNKVMIGPEPQWAVPSNLMPVPESASGPVFVRRQDVLVHVDEHGGQEYRASRIKILQSSALELGNISISWDPAAGTPVVHAIKVYRGNDVIDVLKSASFEILRREDQLEAARLDGKLTAVLRIPDLRVGDELEVDFTHNINDPTLGNQDAGLLFMGPSPPPGRYRLELSWDKGWKPHVQISADMAKFAKNSEHAFAFRFFF